MSDSDDTDVLLLVPPDFFVINSPPCLSPFDQECSANRPSNISSRHVETFVSTMENRLLDSSPSQYRSHQYSIHINRNNEFTPIICSDLSVERTDSNKISSWSLRNDDFFQNTFDKCKSMISDVVISDTAKGGTTDVRNNESGATVRNDSSQSPKFSLRQVDKLLSEMEKTRSEIKNKLQTNKNKIHEMRREYTSNNSLNRSSNLNNNTSSMAPTKNAVSNLSKPANTEEFSFLKKPLNTDVDITAPSEPKNVLHLTKIMSNDNDFETVRQKLEAEIMKKKHCEELILQLQSTLLEHQQNMSVAVKIDAQKDEIIEQLRKSWAKLVEHWKELEHQRQDLARMIEKERQESANVRTIYHQKSEQLENRLLEAVSLANGFREKNEKLEQTLNEAQCSLRTNKDYIKSLEMEKNQLVERLEQFTKDLADEKEKRLLFESQVSDLKSQMTSLSCERNELSRKHDEQSTLISQLEAEILKLQLNYTQANDAELAALKETNSMKQEIIKLKNSLKEFYQKQLDTVLREKVDEFQKEIDKAQALMHVELRKQEKQAEDKLQTEISRLKDEHKFELSEERRINQKHVHILKGELKENRKRILDLENRLKLDLGAKEKLSELIQSALRTQRIDMLNDVSDILDGSSKELQSINGNERFPEFSNLRSNDDDVSDFEFKRDPSLSTDLRKYVEMLLEREPGNPVEKEMALRSLFSDKDFADKKSYNPRQQDDLRRKPPWK